MGSTKNKSPAQKEKTQSTKDAGKKGKKDKAEGGSGAPKAEIIVTLSEEQAMKAIKGSKVITVQELARQTGVKISAANAFLKRSAGILNPLKSNKLS